MSQQSYADVVRDLQLRLGRKPRICILSVSNIPDDPRVRRQGDAFAEAGWEVVAIGLPEWRSAPPVWPVYTFNDASRLEENQTESQQPVQTAERATERKSSLRVSRVVYLRGLIGAALRKVLPAGGFAVIRSGVAKVYAYFAHARWFVLRASQELKHGLSAFRPDSGIDAYLQVKEIGKFYSVASLFEADIYLANDWHMLPVAIRAAQRHNAQFCYDTHEYALEEYKYRLRWRLTRRPLVRSIETIGLRDALVASTVSRGIADDMKREYRLSREILEIRNVPNYTEVVAAPPGQFIEVLYHGLIVWDRGLEECIRSVPFWRDEFRFVLRGPGSSDYLAKLKAVAQSLGVADRVVFAPPVPMTELVRAASGSQIGISTPPRTTKHNIYALPNKFFEYIQAELAICISDLPDMAAIVRQYDLGRTIKDLSPQSIAEAINGFDRVSIARYRTNSRAAAKTLNWETEKNKLVASYSSELLRKIRMVDATIGGVLADSSFA